MKEMGRYFDVSHRCLGSRLVSKGLSDGTGFGTQSLSGPFQSGRISEYTLFNRHVASGTLLVPQPPSSVVTSTLDSLRTKEGFPETSVVDEEDVGPQTNG